MRLSRKMMLLLFVLVLMPVWLIGYFFSKQSYQTVLDHTLATTNASMEQIKVNMKEKLMSYVQVSNLILAHKELRKFLDAPTDDYQAQLNSYNNLIVPEIERYSLVNPYLKATVYTGNKQLLVDRSNLQYDDEIKNEPWYQAVKRSGGQAIRWRGIYRAGVSGKPVFSLLRPLSQDNKVIGILQIQVEEADLYTLISEESANKDIFILNPEGEIMSSNRRDTIGQRMGDVLSSMPEWEGRSEIEYKGTPSYAFMKSLSPGGDILGWSILSVVSLDRLSEEAARTRSVITVVTVLLLLWCSAAVYLMSSSLAKRIRQLGQSMHIIRKGEFGRQVDVKGKDELADLGHTFNLMSLQLNELVKEVYEAELDRKDLQLKQKQMELKALQSQINPHFLFNTLDSIRTGLLRNKDVESAERVQLLAGLFRRTIRWEGDYVPMSKEMEFVEDYLKLQKMRFKDKFDYSMDMDPEAREVLIPKFIVQPLVENAIIHGIEPMERNGLLAVSAKIVGGVMAVTVRDNGCGLTPDQLQALRSRLEEGGMGQEARYGIGLSNVYDRLKHTYGTGFTMKLVRADGGGTEVQLQLPIMIQEENRDVQSSNRG